MIKNSLVSVVIPTKNRPARLQSLIEKLRVQSLQPHEVIVIDDGSEPPLQNEAFDHFIASQRGLRTLVHRIDASIGSSGARNLGASKATGDLLVFIDDDVLPHQDLLRRHLELHESDSRRLLVMGRLKFWPELNETPLTRLLEHRLDFSEVSGWRKRNPIGGLVSSVVSITRNSFLETGGFELSFTRNEDTEFGQRCQTEHSISLVFEELCTSHHNSTVNLPSYFDNCYSGGLSKARWSIKSPDETEFGLQLNDALSHFQEKSNYIPRFSQWLSKHHGKYDVVNFNSLTDEELSNFERELKEFSAGHRLLGLLDGWLGDTFSGGQLRRRGQSEQTNLTSLWLGSGFFPGEWLLVRNFVLLSQPQRALSVLQNMKENRWTQLAQSAILASLGQMPQNISDLEKIARIDQCTATRKTQAELATAILDLMPMSSEDSCIHVLNKLFRITSNSKPICSDAYDEYFKAQRAHNHSGDARRGFEYKERLLSLQTRFEEAPKTGTIVFQNDRLIFVRDSIDGRIAMMNRSQKPSTEDFPPQGRVRYSRRLGKFGFEVSNMFQN